MKVFPPLAAIAATAAVLAASAGAALAGIGQPSPWQIGMQGPVTPVAQDIYGFNTFLFWITTAIAAFVLVLLAIIIVRFNARKNPVPSRTTHNTLLEVIWTIVPVLILLLIAVPSFGVRIDAIPGRINDTWFKATREGMYYGQCSELCGVDHAFMPIAVRVVSDQEFTAWAAQAKQKYAAEQSAPPTAVAAATGPAQR